MKSIVIGLVIGSILAHVCYFPLPDGLGQPATARMTYAIGKTVQLLTSAAEMVGVMDNVAALRIQSTVGLWFAGLGYRTYSYVEDIDTTFDGVGVRIHIPNKELQEGKLQPGIIYMHGGGWVRGSVDSTHYVTHSLAAQTGAVVVSIKYRLAPEHKFPIPLEDCLKASVWFMQHANEYNVDPQRIAISGGSAGGNLAAAVAQAFTFDERYSSLPKLKFQGLVYPCLQAVDFSLPSYQQNGDVFYLPRLKMIKYWSWYLNGDLTYVEYMVENNHTSPDIKAQTQQLLGHGIIPNSFKQSDYTPPKSLKFGDGSISDRLEPIIMNPLFAPLMKEDLRGLPPAYILTAEFDVLRDDGILYAKRLEEASVEVTWNHYDDGFHGIFGHAEGPLRCDAGERCFGDFVQYAKDNL